MDELLQDLRVRGIGCTMRLLEGGVSAELTYEGKTVAKSFARYAQCALVDAMMDLDWRKYRVRRAA
jgi:hypothetical protein